MAVNQLATTINWRLPVLKRDGERQVGLIKEVLTEAMLVEAMKRGEREVANTIYGVSMDHQCRYRWVASKVEESDVILDAICGIGYGSYIMGQVGMKKPRAVHSFDICKEAIEYGNEFYRADNVHLEVADYFHLEYPEEMFSKIVHFEALEHIELPDYMLRKFHQWMKPDGILYISCPNEVTNPFSKERYPFHMRHFTPNEMEAMLREAGFRVMEWFSQGNERSTTIDAGTDGVTMIAVAKKV
jgi:2-polyprenyl-3-methyl-5-hydroxy-6-metoxy-1,4-benzoquinol methylase